jgi:polar amino acid transport system substrate-binding protein
LSRDELRVGVSLATPWAMRDDEGEFSGFEIDIARQLAADMDVSVQFLRYDHNALVRAIEANEIDLIAAGLTITPDRALHVNFSRPYATGGIGMVTNLESTADVERLEQLNSPEYTVAVMADSAAEDLAMRVLPRARRQAFRSEDEASEALIAGDVDVYLEQEPIPSYLAVEYPRNVDLPVSRPLLETRSAFAVSKGDPDFVIFLNAWIEAREADTWLPTRYQYWFKTLQWRD